MKKLKDLPQKERPREKLLQYGPGCLRDHELLAIILGKGTKKNDVLYLAHKIVKIIDRKGLSMEVEDLIKIEGIGTARATSITAAFEFVRRRIKPEGLKIIFPSDVLPLIQHYGDRKQEHFLSISVNGANEVMNVRVVTIGLVNTAQVHPREVFADVICERASAVIIAHNHPSGDLNPSREDLSTTHMIKEAAKVLGIQVLDHIIFNTRGYYSLQENNQL